MNKQLKRTLMSVLLCIAALLCALSILSILSRTSAVSADDAVIAPATEITGYNLYDVNQAKWPNGNYVKFLDLSNSTDEYKDVECIQDFGTNNFVFRNPYMYFKDSVTYQISYKINALEGSGNSWSVYPRAIIDGSVQTMENKTSEQDGEWSLISYTFTASKTSSETIDNKNCFDFVFEKFVNGDIVQIKDIKVIYPKSAEKKTNLWNNDLKFGGGAAMADKMNVTDMNDETYGTVQKYQLKDGITTTNINIRTDYTWKKDVKYHISFMYKTEKGLANSFSQGYSIIRSKGKANVVVGGNVFSSNYKGLEFAGEWKMYNYDFEKTDSYPANENRGENTFDIFLVGFNPGDAFYVTNFRITAECNSHDSVVQYTWAEDNSTCTASYSACTICGTVPSDPETVTTTSVDTATCTENGKITYTAVFENEAFETQTKEVDSEAIGHVYGEVVYTWSEDNTECTATKSCTVNGCDGKIEEKAAASKTEVPATCTEKGKITYTVTFENEEFEAQTKEVETDAKGHSYKDGKCENCNADDPDYVKPEEPKEEKSGCKSSISMTIAYLVTVLVAAAIFVIVKRNIKKKD